ncbi:FAD-binding oxidoreductase [Streptomyces sp. A7024]|uniref:FAD-binding oxidoreductase n=1 Tax=Streptomyces coryli TaxID=1128680 RepID=A0A6G4TX50_9ACTN|nr:FAD-binding oxidoreductase [Streptomyces coryli]NGN64555.1 FAD-binding oxidoreductase [Streptomyces coryli]
MTTTPAQAARRELTGFRGRITGPGDAGYDEARAIYNAMHDKRPAVVASCTDAADAARVIRFARSQQLPLAVRGGGHHGAGLGSVDDGIVLDLSPMNEISVDPERRTVRVGGGAVWGDVDRATYEHGLAVPSGIISTTGVGGLTLGGGVGHLTRRGGLTIDNLLEADVVLASGESVRANSTTNPELFWALRGGGGNFGVVTSFVFRAHPVGDVIAGPTFWPVEQTAEVLVAYRDFIGTAPRDLNGFFLIGAVPPAEPFPEDLWGHKICGVVWHYAKPDLEAAQTAMKPFLDVLPEPLLHGPHEVPHPGIQAAFDGLYPPGQQWYWRADFVRDIPDDAAALHAKFAAELPTGQSTMHLYPVSGAAHDLASEDTAWSFRDANFASVYAGVDADAANADLVSRWTVDYFDALHPYSMGGAYVNMMMDEGQERVRASYRDNYARLARIKAEYDPENVFRINQNIEPAASV